MINPAVINPLELPSVPLLNRKNLHRWGGVYFVIRDKQEVLYVGQSPLIKDRWNQHQCLKRLNEDDKQRSRIYWFAADENLKALEAAFIHRFQPLLNRYYPPLSPEQKIDASVQVKRVVETVLDFPGLGQKIRQARERDQRTLTDICRDCKLSRSYWYQLEKEDLRAPATEDVIRRIEQVLNIDLGVNFE